MSLLAFLLYELPSFIEVMSGHFKKLDWKGIVKMSINDLLDYKATTGSFLTSLYTGQLVIM
jgi:hypothetical protein